MIRWKCSIPEKYIPEECRLLNEFSIRNSPIVGGDRDEHGCIGSAGYVWCEVQKDCIRLFEKGIRTESVDDSNASAFIVFSA